MRVVIKGLVIIMNTRISLKVITGFGEDIDVQIKKNVKMEELFEKICTKFGIHKSSAHFKYNERKMNLKKTPLDLKMERNDQIFLIQDTTGG